MRKETMMRWSLASAVLVACGTGLLASGCSDDENPINPGGTDAGGKDSSPGTIDTDGGTDAGDGGGSVAPPRLNLVHASPDMPQVSFCMGVTVGSTTSFALDDVFPVDPNGGNSPGLPQGSGGPLRVDATRAVLIPTVDITPFAIPTASLAGSANGKSCKALIPDPNAPAVGIVRFPTIVKGTLLANKSYVIAVAGCASTTTSADLCGRDSAGAALKPSMLIFEVNKGADTPATSTGFQFLHLSPAAESFVPTGASAPPFGAGVRAGVYQYVEADAGMGGDAGDGGAPERMMGPITELTASGLKALSQPTSLKSVTGFSATAHQAGIWPGPVTPATRGPIEIPFTAITAFSLGVSSDGSINPPGLQYWQTGKAYTLVAVGDPRVAGPTSTSPAAGPNFFRIIALMNDPQ